MLLKFGSILALLSFSPNFAGAVDTSDWSMSSEVVQSKERRVTYHQLTFTSAAKVLSYVPQKPPYGLVSEKRISLEGNIYFVTGWAHGPSTILYRVFSPNLSKSSRPLCEAPSLSENAQLKVFGDKIKISTYLKPSDQATWVECGKRPRKVNEASAPK